MPTITKVPIGAEDINFDTGGAGTTTAFTRTEPTGPDASYSKVNASQLPVLDAAVVTSARTPFAAILAADRDVEECLKKIRINAREMKNIEHYGATAGSGVSAAVAERNTQAWQQCLTDINTEGRNNGIYFPGARYEFKDLAAGAGLYAAHILPFETSTPGTNVSNVFVCGAPGTSIVANANAAATKSLFFATGTSNLFFADVVIQHLAANTASCVMLNPAAAGIMSNTHFDRCSFVNGQTQLRLNYTAGANYVKNVWVTNCSFSGTASYSVTGSDVDGAVITGNTVTSSGAGFNLSAIGNTAFGKYTITGNRLTASTNTIRVHGTSGGGPWSSAIHNTANVSGNFVGLEIYVLNTNAVTVANNRIGLGHIRFAYDITATDVYEIRIIGNDITGDTTMNGIELASDSVNLRRFWICDNTIYNTGLSGITVGTGLGLARNRGGDISNNMILDCGQDAHNTYDGISLYCFGGTDGTSETFVNRNRITSTNAAVKHRYGISEQTGAQNNNNRFFSNMSKGWGSGAISVTGAGSTDRINAAQATTASTIDFGTGV